jgi:hypothetical protein
MTISRPYMYLGPGLVTPSPGLFLRSMNGRIENRSGNEGRRPARRLGKDRRGGALDPR